VNVLGVIGGTGLDQWGGLENTFSGETPYGSASAPIAAYMVGDTQLLFIARHGRQHNIPPDKVNYRANLYSLHQAGVKDVIAVNAVGAMTEGYEPGMLAVPDQLIDYTWGREQSFSDGGDFGLQHIEFTHPFAGPLRSRVLEAARAWSVPVLDGGCVGVVQGPRLETDAEIRRLQRDGCDIVGMTSMPEASLARELGMDYASICPIANWAAGIADQAITMEAIQETIRDAVRQARTVIEHLCRNPVA
jgi:5'-deoxy-5'-methylthioadenosine phosphorylase